MEIIHFIRVIGGSQNRGKARRRLGERSGAKSGAKSLDSKAFRAKF